MAAGAEPTNLFDTRAPTSEWSEFAARGFTGPVCGVIFSPAAPPSCGMPLGGLSTGCINLDVRGVLGMSDIFSDFTLTSPNFKNGLGRGVPCQLPLMTPFLGLAVGTKTWVLAAPQIVQGGPFQADTEPALPAKYWAMRLPKIEGVESARNIHYWGHYPVADVEFETGAPVSVGLRAWSPFLPGNAVQSSIPGAIFEVHLRNVTAASQSGRIAFSFPGPRHNEARGAFRFYRHKVEFKENGFDFRGISVTADAPLKPEYKPEYILGVIDCGSGIHFGKGLGSDGLAWKTIGGELAQPVVAADAASPNPGTTAAVDYSLPPGGEQIVRFVLAWYAPSWIGQDGRRYTYMYATRYRDATDVARNLLAEHETLLHRILAWQEVIYSAKELPVWLRDSLINNLALIPHDSFWTEPNEAMPWVGKQGFFGMMESPRGCPQICCIPCDWYGDMPIAYFFPKLEHSTIKAYKHYVRKDGEAPFTMGGLQVGRPYASVAGYGWQVTLNGTCFVDLVDQLWLRTGDDAVLKEFYDAVKRTTFFTMNLRPGPDGVISMPKGNGGMEWFEAGEWAGMCAHLGGLHLAQLRMAERMAIKMGDSQFARRCHDWLQQGSEAMEQKMWADDYYLNFFEPGTGKKSDDVMANQLDGEWAAEFHGLPGVFRDDRVKTTLQTIRRCNIKRTRFGAVNFCRPDGSLLDPKSPIGAYGIYDMFAPEVQILAMTYMYAGETNFGLELARRSMENLARRYEWDLPNRVNGKTGKRTFGTDYYQNMMLWSLVAALSDEDLSGPVKPGGLVYRILQAAKTPEPKSEPAKSQMAEKRQIAMDTPRLP